jgi:hypothetical protein
VKGGRQELKSFRFQFSVFRFPFSPYNNSNATKKGEHTGSPLQKQQKKHPQ